MPAKTLAIASSKGGSSKSTTSLNLSAAFAKRGDRVLMLDLDPQSSLTLMMNIDAQDSNLADVLGIFERGTVDLASIIQNVSNNLDLAPGDIMLSRTELGLVARGAREYQLQKAIESVLDQYDRIIVDCPPSVGLLVINALIACQHVIIPTTLDALSLRGLGIFVQTMEETREDYSSIAKLLGVLPAAVDLRTVHARDVLEVLRGREDLRLFETTIPRRIAFAEAAAAQESIFDYDPLSDGAVAYENLAQEVIDRGA